MANVIVEDGVHTVNYRLCSDALMDIIKTYITLQNTNDILVRKVPDELLEFCCHLETIDKTRVEKVKWSSILMSAGLDKEKIDTDTLRKLLKHGYTLAHKSELK